MEKITQAIKETLIDIKNSIVNWVKNVILKTKLLWNSFVDLFKFKV